MPLKLSEMLLGGEQGSGEDNRLLREGEGRGSQDRYFWNDLNLWTPTITSPGRAAPGICVIGVLGSSAAPPTPRDPMTLTSPLSLASLLGQRSAAGFPEGLRPRAAPCSLVRQSLSCR